MTDFSTHPPISGQLRAGVLPINGMDTIHTITLNQTLKQHIASEARHHDAQFNCNGFRNVLRLIEQNRAHAYVLAIGTEDATTNEIAGSTIEFPSVMTTWNGHNFEHCPAVYGEDIFVTPELSLQFKQASPNHSLGTFFIKEKYQMSATNSQKIFPHNMNPCGMILEFGAGNKAIEALLKKMGAHFDDNKNNTIVSFDRSSTLPRSNKDDVITEVETLGTLSSENIVATQPHIFVVTARNENNTKKIALSLTESMSTFTGNSVIRAQLTSNSNLNDKDLDWTKRSLITALLEAKKEVVNKRKWFSWSRSAINPADFLSSMVFHAKNESIIISSLRSLGAKTRQLGKYSMMPMILDFNNMPSDFMPEKPSHKQYMIIRERNGEIRGIRQNGLKPVETALSA